MDAGNSVPLITCGAMSSQDLGHNTSSSIEQPFIIGVSGGTFSGKVIK